MSPVAANKQTNKQTKMEDKHKQTNKDSWQKEMRVQHGSVTGSCSMKLWISSAEKNLRKILEQETHADDDDFGDDDDDDDRDDCDDSDGGF